MNEKDPLKNEHTGSYWDEQYSTEQTGWDLKDASPPLKKYIDTIKNKDIAILIPGCGNAYEAEYLLQQGFTNITLVDISTVLTNRLTKKYQSTPIQVINQNFFDHKAKYDLILEQTFFCALHPSFRERYVTQCIELLNDHGKIAGLLFNKKIADHEPPYTATNAIYMELFSPWFHFLRFENCMDSIKPRLGSELFVEFEKKTN